MLSPYEIVVAGSGYEFTTSHQITYYVYFIDVSETFGEKSRVFSFGFEPKNQSHESALVKDVRIADTIAKIIDSFFIVNDNVIVYVPYDSIKSV